MNATIPNRFTPGRLRRLVATGRKHSVGFTLIEVTITLALLAMAAVVVVPAINNLTRADLRASASKVSALVRQTYDAAALSGATHRLIFDFESTTIAVEKTDKRLSFDGSSNDLVETSQARETVRSLTEVPADLRAMLEASAPASDSSSDLDASPMSGFAALLGGGGDQVGEPVEQDADAEPSLFGGDVAGAEALRLDDGIKVLDVWVQGMTEPAIEGRAYLYFFPSGYTQDAIVHLEDREGTIYSVRVAALTGHAQVIDEYVEVPK